MTIDRGLITLAEKAIAAKPRRHVKVPDLLAVVMQESHGMPYFTDTKPGSTYSLNIAGAIAYYKSVPLLNLSGEKMYDEHGHLKTIRKRFETGLKPRDIQKAIIIPETIGKFRPPKVMIGQKAKFRFEYAYWERFHNIEDPIKRFRMASSWGMVQFMGPNIAGDLKGDEADLFIQRFAADVPMQLLYGAGLIDQLLTQANGSLERAYKGYNSGNIDSTNRDVIVRAKSVARNAAMIEAEIRRK